MEEVINYIVQFLLGKENAHFANQVGYADNSTASVVIVPSHFFDDNIYMTQGSMPQMPLDEIDGVPLLFGTRQIIRNDRQIIVSADIVASTYFLITRYEECLNNTDRDTYGRFIGTKSLPYRAGFLMRPVVDEYGKLLRGWLRETGVSVKEPLEGYEHIYLTHDVDQIWQWDNLYHALKTSAKRFISGQGRLLESLRSWFDYEKYDNIYTFPWITEMDGNLIKCLGKECCTSIYFFKAGGDSLYDNSYFKKRCQVKKLADYLEHTGAVLGLHSSFSAGEDPAKIRQEKETLEEILGKKVSWNRHHYLCSKEPQDMQSLISAGITDDFTMGYADTVGFRLGTCQAVRWIDPLSKQLTLLTLHPLTVMECTLDSEMYMNLQEEKAYDLICKLLEITRQFHGEAVLLWHNTSLKVFETGYQRRMYEKTLEKLRRLNASYN